MLALHRIGSGGLLPDLTLLIEVSPAVAVQRTTLRDGDAKDRIGGREVAYHGAVVAAFGALADREPARFARIDGDGSREQTHGRIVAAVDARC